MTIYNYLYQYTDINNGEVVDIASKSSYQTTIDDLFLSTFTEYCERDLNYYPEYAASTYSFPLKISHLLGKTAELFEKMQFKFVSVNIKPSEPLGFGKVLA